MEKLKFNETPIRTSKNFGINDIKLENIDFPTSISTFKNVSITNNNKNTKFQKADEVNLKYGNGDLLTKQVNEISNNNLKIILEENEGDQININYLFDDKNSSLVENIEIIARKNSKALIILKYNSIEDLSFYHNLIIRTNASENSNIEIILVNLINEYSQNFVSIQSELAENSNLKYTIIDFGGKNSITNYYSNLNGAFSNNELNTIYLGKNNQLFDLNYIGELRGESTNINIEVQGALKDEAKKHFKGTIDFKKGAKKAKGNENESCMLLSDKAKSIALPMLLCSEEDVEGNHSSSAGKISEKELFYVMSRGFELKEAMKLMVRARFNNIIKNIQDENLLEEVLNEIDKRLD